MAISRLFWIIIFVVMAFEASASGIWISRGELAKIPISGQPGCEAGTFCDSAWKRIIAKADSDWGNPDLTTYDLPHPPGVLAAAIASSRLSFEPGSQADSRRYFDKALQGLSDVMGTEKPALPNPDGSGGKTDGSLSIARQFPFYIAASDILDLYPDGNPLSFATKWRAHVDYMAHGKFTFIVGDGGHNFSEGHESAASNGNAMAGAARIASAAYLNDKPELDRAWLTFRRYTGDRSIGPELKFNVYSQTWVHDESALVAINPVGATCHDKAYPADGVIPNDQGRGGACPSDTTAPPPYTQYPWEGLQGVFAQAVMLDRLGYADPLGNDPWSINDKALLRAVKYQWFLQSRFGGSWYDGGRAAWVKHLAHVVYDFKPLEYAPSGGGRNTDFTQWTHPNGIGTSRDFIFYVKCRDSSGYPNQEDYKIRFSLMR